MIDVFSEQAEHPLPDGRLRLLGAVDQVTGAMTSVEISSARILVDAGVCQGKEARGWRLPRTAPEHDGLILTHAHFDHVGALPEIILEGFSGPIFGTPATLEIAKIVLKDSLRLGRESSSNTRRVLEAFKEQSRPSPYGVKVPLSGGVAFRLLDAGHILGSASVEICSDATRLVLSGDLGRPETPILRSPHTQWGPRPVDLLLMESTYGDRNHSRDHSQIGAALKKVLLEAMSDKGRILIPSFAIGRTQTLLWHLNELVESGQVDGLTVAVDTPMGLRVTEVYDNNRALYDRQAVAAIARGDDPLDFDQLYGVCRARESRRLDEIPGPLLVIAGSGMCTGGRIVNHLQNWLPDPTTTLLFIGYQARGTPGRAIQASARRGDGHVDIGGQRVALGGKVQTLSGLSAHAGQEELLAWAQNFPLPAAIALHHGEPKAQQALATRLRSELGARP